MSSPRYLSRSCSLRMVRRYSRSCWREANTDGPACGWNFCTNHSNVSMAAMTGVPGSGEREGEIDRRRIRKRRSLDKAKGANAVRVCRIRGQTDGIDGNGDIRRYEEHLRELCASASAFNSEGIFGIRVVLPHELDGIHGEPAVRQLAGLAQNLWLRRFFCG